MQSSFFQTFYLTLKQETQALICAFKEQALRIYLLKYKVDNTSEVISGDKMVNMYDIISIIAHH